MINVPDRRSAVELINGAVEAGAPKNKACGELEISSRTYRRWTQYGSVKADGRPDAERPEPANKLTPEERQQILKTCNEVAYQSLPPSQIVPALADKATCIASESSFYRVLKDADQLHHRGKNQAPRKVAKPEACKAAGPNEVWSWDITFLATTITGLFYRLYLVMDIYSRKIVGWEIHENETAENASLLIRKACLAEGVSKKGLVLHSDNGSPMKGATMLATLQRLGVVPSFSRPSVSNDNPYSESLFGTMKYTPAFPSKPFESLDAARECCPLVQRRASPQRDSICDPGTTSHRHGAIDSDETRCSLPGGEATKSRTMESRNAKPGASRRRVAEPGKRWRRED